MNILFLATDAYGGHGGIAYYNRCLAEALAEMTEVQRITLLPRSVKSPPGTMPQKVSFKAQAAGSKARYVLSLFEQATLKVNMVICGHINLLPMAAAFAAAKRVPLILQVHGIDVWQAPSKLKQTALRQVNQVWAVSSFTRDRMNVWAQLPLSRYTVIHNTIHVERYGMAPKRPDLEGRYGLHGKKVILTLARLDARERYKGIDEILEAMPSLLQQEPNLCYVVAGDGDDQDRLRAKAQQLGIAQQVVFAGYVPEADKADLLRLADVFAMPGRGEGFGIVYLEAMACGVPVVGSLLDGSRDALMNGQLGTLVDPNQPASLQTALLAALKAPKQIPPGLASFAWPAYSQQVAQHIQLMMATHSLFAAH